MTASLPPTPPIGDDEWAQLARFVAGELPPAEASAVRTRIAADASLARLVSEIESIDLRRQGSTSPDVEAALRRVKMRMHSAPRQSIVRYLLPLAAALVGAVGLFMYTRSTPTETTTVAAAAPQVYRTTTGARDSIVLADGSRVTLGPGSELTVPAEFPRKREVLLKGQARFDVVHDDSRLFSVRTAQALITDLGTVFTINDFDGAAVDVTVQSGSVRLSPAQSADRGVILKAGDAGAISTRGVLTHGQGAASDDDSAWMSGRLVFREASMVQVRAELRRWYGVELVMSDSSIAAGHFTGSFREEPVAQVLDIIALAVGAKHEVRGDTILFQSAGRR